MAAVARGFASEGAPVTRLEKQRLAQIGFDIAAEAVTTCPEVAQRASERHQTLPSIAMVLPHLT